MNQYGTLVVYLYCTQMKYIPGAAGAMAPYTRRMVVAKYRDITNIDAQDVVNHYASTLQSKEFAQYVFQFQPDAITLVYSTSHK